MDKSKLSPAKALRQLDSLELQVSASVDASDSRTPAKRCRIDDSSSSTTGRRNAPLAMLVTPAAAAHQAPFAPTPMKDKDSIRSLLLTEAGYDSSSAHAVPKRTDYISWDEYFLAVAALSAQRSKDPFRPTGACIVDCNNRIIGIGYNGFPSGCSDDCLPWNNAVTTSSEEWLHTQEPYVVHAEFNAVLNKVADCVGARLYKLEFPCNECAKLIAQVGIAEVVYVHEGPENDSTRASRIMLNLAGVKLRKYEPVRATIELDFWSHLNETEQQSASSFVTIPPESKDGVKDSAVQMHREMLCQEVGYDPQSSPSWKRKNALGWDDYFMAVAFLTARRSKDPNTQVGACIVDKDKRVVGLGYNGFPAGCSDDVLPWNRSAESKLHTKYLYVCHAEVNAILNKRSADVKGATLFVALFPCNECAKSIIQAGIKTVVYMSDKYHDTPGCRASRVLLKMAGVELRRHIPAQSKLRIDLREQGSLSQVTNEISCSSQDSCNSI